MTHYLSIKFIFGLFLIISAAGCPEVNEAPEDRNEQEVEETEDQEIKVPGWMSEAVIYEITPYNFVQNGTFKSIEAKLPELKELGVNTIWLQPVTNSSYRGQGYDVVDYFGVNPDLGTEEELHDLVDTANKLGMRVLFDVVLNHTSIEHPYAQDVIDHGMDSQYYSFYQHEMDNKPYSSFYNRNEEGFIVYFWEDLVNLNYKNEQVQQWMLEVCKYWVREYDIDGYRFDAIWGVNARNPAFMQDLIQELKNMKPDILLLAEDKGRGSNVFELGFDAAYDWTADTSWVSQWAWEYEYNHDKNLTIFKYPGVDKRGDMLREALFGDGQYAHRLLRYIGNNDMPHLVGDHTLKQTKMAAALMFGLPGIPMLYNGQEIGKEGHPYSIDAVFKRDSSIRSLSQNGLFDYYQKLIHLHKEYPALSGNNMDKLSVSPSDAIVAFHRWEVDQNVVVVINMDSRKTTAQVDISETDLSNLSAENRQLRDVLSGAEFELQENDNRAMVEMEGHSVRWLVAEEK